jgi:hypothetical protein
VSSIRVSTGSGASGVRAKAWQAKQAKRVRMAAHDGWDRRAQPEGLDSVCLAIFNYIFLYLNNKSRLQGMGPISPVRHHLVARPPGCF